MRLLANIGDMVGTCMDKQASFVLDTTSLMEHLALMLRMQRLREMS
jgi:hypothetical protein